MARKRDTSGKIRVRVLGGVEFQIGSRRIGMNTEVLFGLGLFLTTRAGERIPRDEILETFWAKGSDAQRRHALRQLLYRLRQKGLILDEDGDHVRLDPARVDSDLRAALNEEWVEKATAAEVEAAGKFGPVFSRRQAAAFLSWMDELRDAVSQQHRKASLRQITVARREGRWADLERWAQQVLKSDPLNEEATLARAESAAMAGSKTIAIEILDNYLAEVGDISPELGKPALALRKRLAERRADWTVRGPKEVPLVGRTELMSRLTGLVEAAWRGEGAAVVLVGAPGIGKTRLAMETRAYAELKGMRTVVVRAEAGNFERPLATALALVRLVMELPGSRGSNPSAYALLERISESSIRAGRLHEIVPNSLGASLIDSMAEVLEAVVAEVRLLVLIDDAHHIDASSIPIVSRLAATTRNRRVLWLLTSRGDGREGAARQLIQESFACQRVLPLDRLSSAALVQRVLEAHRLNLCPESIDTIAQVSGGNPLFARELGAHRALSSDADALPGSLLALMADRTGRMNDQQIRLLRIISLLDTCATVARVRLMAGVGHVEFSAAIEAFESDGLVTLHESRLHLHESWQQHLNAELGKASRAALALECAEAILLSEEPSIEEKWRAAELLYESGDRRRSKVLFQEAGNEMLRRGLPNEAAAIFTRVLELSSTTQEQLVAKRYLAEAHHARGDLLGVVRCTEELLDLVYSKTTDSVALTNVTLATCHRADALAKLHRTLPRELDWLRRACYHEDLPAETRHFAAYTGIRRAIFAEDKTLAREFHQRALDVTRVAAESVPGALVRLIYEAEYGTPAGVLQANEILAQLPISSDSLALRSNTLRFRAAAVRMAGFYELSATLGEEAFKLASHFRQSEIAANVAEMMTFLYLDAENLEAAAEWMSSWRRHALPEANKMRDQGFAHAEARLTLQRGDPEAARKLIEPRLGQIYEDKMVSRRLGELCTYALAAALSGKRKDARGVLDEAAPMIEKAEAEFLLDYPNEVYARAARALGDPVRAVRSATDYARKRKSVFPRPLPSFYVELEAATELTA